MRFVSVGLGAIHSPYHPMWELQRSVHGEVADGARPDTVLLVEHEAVYTAGRRTHLAERPQDGTPVVDIDRGGKVTWHGPGQIVAYPIVRLRSPIDVLAYVRALEEAVMDVCTGLGLSPIRVDGLTGVWLPADDRGGERKICSIGVRVSRGVTMHGLALNCDPDLGQFERIVPCGIPDADMTSLSRELGRDVTVTEVAPLLEHALRARLAEITVPASDPRSAADLAVSQVGAPDVEPAVLS